MERQSVVLPIRKDRVSSGDMKHGPFAQKDQGSQGALKTIQSGDFRTTHESIEELEVHTIQPCSEIPDFLEPTFSQNAVVVKTPDRTICIDGWDKIEKARSEKKTLLLCHVYHCSECSPLELAIRKTAIRTLPQGGKCSYAELIRNVKILENMLMSSMDNPVKYSHGGTRRGINYTDNRENNVRTVLAERLGKSVTTINNYLCHGEYLNDEIINVLVESREGKKFFESAQSNKRILQKDLKADGKSDEDVTAAISEKIPSWLEEFRQNNGRITPIIYEGTSVEIDEDASDEKTTPKANSPRDFNHHNNEIEADGMDKPSYEEVYGGFKRIGNALLDMGMNPRPLDELIDKAKRQMSDYALLIQQMIDLQKLEQKARDKEEK